jgi:hypothetical protein
VRTPGFHRHEKHGADHDENTLIAGGVQMGPIVLSDELITVRCDLETGERYRETIFDFTRHREPQHYRLIVERKWALAPPASYRDLPQTDEACFGEQFIRSFRRSAASRELESITTRRVRIPNSPALRSGAPDRAIAGLA